MYKINISKKLLNAGLSDLKFLSKPLFKRFQKRFWKNVARKAWFNNYIFERRVQAFYLFKKNTVRRVVYGKHFFLTSFLNENLLSGKYNYGICQLAMQKKSEFQQIRDFVLDNNLNAFLLSKRNIAYLSLYGFNKPFFQNLLQGGYTFVFYSSNLEIFTYFLLRKMMYSLISKKKELGVNVKSYFKFLDSVKDKLMFSKITFLHYNLQSMHIASFVANRMFQRSLFIPLFSNNVSFNSINWYKQPIVLMLNHSFLVKFLILLLNWRFLLLKN